MAENKIVARAPSSSPIGAAMMQRNRAVAILFLFGLVACTSVTETNPPRSATEQLLISTAADRAAAKLAVKIPAKTPVFVDAGNFEGTDSKYAIAAIHDSLLKQNVYLVDDKKKAKIVIEIRSGALSIDKKQWLFGTPSFSVPIPLAGSTFTFPQIALYGTETQEGIAKFAFVSYDAENGALIQSEDPQYGFARNTKKTVLIFVSWTENDASPEEGRDTLTREIDRVIPDGDGER
jgi:hypothetical protein